MKKLNLKSFLLTLGLGAVLAGAITIGVAVPTHAAVPDTSLNLITSPLYVNLAGPPGSTLKTDIRIKNGSNHPEKLKVTLMKFSAYGEEGKPALLDRAKGDSYFDWVSFSPQVFDAPSNEWQTVHMTIQLPKTAAFGYYYAVV